MHAVIELAAWAHSEWVRIHPFGNGNGRTARLWANLLLMRYGLRPVLKLHPRPDGTYADAGAMGMVGDIAALAALIRKRLDEAAPGASR
jgi:fido (protein-threonine AMPylation protein)